MDRVKEILLSDERMFSHPRHGVVEVLAFEKHKGFLCETVQGERVYCDAQYLTEFSKSEWIKE